MTVKRLSSRRAETGSAGQSSLGRGRRHSGLRLRRGGAYEVEFVAADGRTLAVETLRADQIEPFTGSQILHARTSTSCT
ncbi:MAG: DUF4926 domain-containing protein [Chloroflexota bacterium]